jgi:integrase
MHKTADKWPLTIKAGSVTVKIYRTVNRGRPMFTVAFHEGGSRKLRQFAELVDARTEAKIIAERLNAGQGAALELTGKDREAYLFAMRKLKPLGIGLATAIEEFADAKTIGAPLLAAAKLYHKTHMEGLPSKAIAGIVEELFTAKKADGASKAYLAPLRTCLDRFARDFKMNIAEAQTRDIDAWLRALKQSPRSRNNHRNGVVLLFNFAKAAGYLNRDQTTAADATSLARKTEAEIEVFTPAEMASLLAAADEVALPFLVLGGFCGLRTAEVLRLQWEDINWPEKVVEIRAGVAKTRTRRMAPLTDAALSWLEAYQNRKGPVVAAKLHRDAVEAACKASGIAWKRNGLRHGFGTYRMATLKDPVRVAYEMGNSPQVIRQSYDRVVTETQGKAWFSIMPTQAANVVQMKGAA